MKELRLTTQRRVILEELRQADSHPTADGVYELVRRRLPHISLGTVYRNLEVLSRHGLIQKLELGGDQRRYDGCLANHYHVRCIRCGRVDDVPVDPMPSLEDALRVLTEYEIVGHSVEFVGLCPHCKEESRGGALTKGGP